MVNSNYIPRGHVGLQFRNGRFVALLAPGTYMTAGSDHKVKVHIAWHGKPWINLPLDELKQLRESTLLKNIAKFIHLKSNQRAWVWLDGHYSGMLGPGLYGYWTTMVDVRIEVFDTTKIRFELEQPEFESVEKIAEKANQPIFVGDDNGMATRIVKLT